MKEEVKVKDIGENLFWAFFWFLIAAISIAVVPQTVSCVNRNNELKTQEYVACIEKASDSRDCMIRPRGF